VTERLHGAGPRPVNTLSLVGQRYQHLVLSAAAGLTSCHHPFSASATPSRNRNFVRRYIRDIRSAVCNSAIVCMDCGAVDRELQQRRNQWVINIYEGISPTVWADHFMQVHENYVK